MSAGRRSVSLAELQQVARDGFATSARRMLLGADAPAGPLPDAPLVAVPDALAAADVDGDWYGHAADWRWRTTHADVRREAAEAAKRRLPEADAPLVDYLAFGRKIPNDLRMFYTGADADRVKDMLRRSAREFLRELPMRPDRKPARERMPVVTSHDGRNSRVVRRFADGTTVCDGEIVSTRKARKILRTVNEI